MFIQRLILVNFNPSHAGHGVITVTVFSKNTPNMYSSFLIIRLWLADREAAFDSQTLAYRRSRDIRTTGVCQISGLIRV